MAALAIMSVGVPESAATVVAGHTALRSGIREMLSGRNGADLSALWQALSPNVMAVRAGQSPASIVIRVTETNAVGASVSRSRSISAKCVTIATRRKIARLFSRGVADITNLVSIHARRYGLGNAATCWGMTSRATRRRSGGFFSLQMLRVIELRTKTQ